VSHLKLIPLVWFLIGCAVLTWDELTGNQDCMCISFIGYQLLWPKLLWERTRSLFGKRAGKGKKL
jgi:hypothetical protein